LTTLIEPPLGEVHLLRERGHGFRRAHVGQRTVRPIQAANDVALLSEHPRLAEETNSLELALNFEQVGQQYRAPDFTGQ